MEDLILVPYEPVPAKVMLWSLAINGAIIAAFVGVGLAMGAL